MSDTIKKDKFVSLTYTITDENNEILERMDLPIKYIHGRDSQVIEKIENALEGCATGDEVSVELSPSEGFGEYQPELTYTDDIENVPPEFRHIGAEIEFQNDKGESRMFRVSNIEDGKLTGPLYRLRAKGVDVDVAVIGSVDQKQLETLMAHGLTPDEAVDVIIMGLLR